MLAQAEGLTVSLTVLGGARQEIWLVEDLLFAEPCAVFAGEALRTLADRAHDVDEFEVQSEHAGEDLTVLRERGVGILDAAFREDAGLDPELTSGGTGPTEVGTVVTLIAENDSWWVSATGQPEDDSGDDGLEVCSLDTFGRFAWPSLGLACSIESFKLADTMDSLVTGSESVFSSITFLPNARGFERPAGFVISRGGTLELAE